MADKPNNTPLHTVRIGGVKATIWHNQSDNGTPFYTTTIVQNYRDKEGNWHESNRHFTEDLPKLELAARKAYEFIHGHTVEQAAEKPKSFQERETKRRTGGKAKAAKPEAEGAAK